jgi:transcription-repair coupling factor (superfamily II helicase)
MISLLFNHLNESLGQYAPYRELEERLTAGSFPVDVEGVQGGFLAMLLEHLQRRSDAPSLLVVPTEQEAREIVDDLSLFQNPELNDRGVPTLKAGLFPWFGTLPYSDARPLPSILGQRVQTLERLLQGGAFVVVSSLRAFLHPLPSPEVLRRRSMSLSAGDTVDTVDLADRLQALGYLRVPRVGLKGEFAVRGEVVDIYPFEGEDAVRLVLDFDRVAEIRGFNPLTQASTVKRPAVRISALREVLFGEEELEFLAANLRSAPSSSYEPAAAEELLEALRLDPEAPGSEYLYPLACRPSVSLLNYLGESSTREAAGESATAKRSSTPKGAGESSTSAGASATRAGASATPSTRASSRLFLLDPERLEAGAQSLRKEYLELYRKARGSPGCLPAPRQILLDFGALVEGFPRTVRFHALKAAAGGNGRIRVASDPPRSFFGNLTFLREELENLLRVGYRIFVFAEYAYQAERLRALLKDLDVAVLPQGISRGFSVPAFKLMVVQENEIFGRKRRIPRSIATAKSEAIDTFVDLNPGDYVVHLHHGIGLFNGIDRMRAAGQERDYIHLEYDGGEKVFLPIEQVNLIQRYVGQEGRRPKLDKLGGKGWQSKKERVRRSVEDMARRLVALYSTRNTVKGFSFGPDTDWQSEFEARFSFQETADQLKAIEEVKLDMESPRPMDRLICGDVGYGKTEVALRAAFKAVMGGKQVAYLAPTTILAEQHFETFEERFRGFPVTVEMLSRFRGRGEQRRVIGRLAEGQVDIVIGTHRLLQKDVYFKNLGLMIVDEEQRFGVRDKERLKELKTSVDCLTLTATPIPRTLHMALMKIRDMSIIDTPPQNRYPIETFIQEFDEEVIARAVRRELERGGQVYYLHNRVQTIPRVEAYLTRLLPGIQMATAHGQMPEDELEEVMHRFIHRETQVLLSTTIIENGLDIPNVNTIIIDRADMFGISQLYQLRGRVGRSDQPAFAYLFFPERRAISELAMKRLRIISDFTELGSGFKIAMKDLEIRGAGNLLGREQHGDILAVGLDMYLKLLEEAIEELNLEEGEKSEQPPEVYLELDYSGYIPDSYISEPMDKMEVYKRIASISGEEELDAVQRRLEDRFGPMPEEVLSLFSLAEIRILCRRLFVTSLKERGGEVIAEFSKVAQLSVDRVLTLIRDSGGTVRLDSKRPNCLILRAGDIDLKHKSEFISERLSRLL